MLFVIFHGSFGTPKKNWEPYIKNELEKLGQQVLTPGFPVDTWNRVTQLGENHASDLQNLHNWTKTFEDDVLPKLKTDQPIYFIAHSLAPVFLLHMVQKYKIQLAGAIFVAPFLEKLNRSWQIDNVNESFYKTDFDYEKLRQFIPASYVLYSDNDPHVPQEKAKDFAIKLGSEEIEVKNAGHFNEDAGYTEFPLLLNLCKKLLSK